MKMKEVCNRCSVSRDTIRHYIRKSILDPPVKDSKNGFGIYSEKHIERVLFIKKLKGFGFSLEEIKEAIDLENSKRLSDQVRINTLESKLKEVDDKVQELLKYKVSLGEALNYLKGRNIEEV